MAKQSNPEDLVKELDWINKLPGEGGTWGQAIREAAQKNADTISGNRAKVQGHRDAAKEALKDLKKLIRQAPFNAKIHGFTPDQIHAATGAEAPAPRPRRTKKKS